jgi:hypothetical protein
MHTLFPFVFNPLLFVVQIEIISTPSKRSSDTLWPTISMFGICALGRAMFLYIVLF